MKNEELFFFFLVFWENGDIISDQTSSFIIRPRRLNFNLTMKLVKVFSLLLTDRLPTTPLCFRDFLVRKSFVSIKVDHVGSPKGTEVRTQQLSKHGSWYHFQSGCWFHLRVNTVKHSGIKPSATFTRKPLLSVRLSQGRGEETLRGDGWWGVFTSLLC